MNFRENALCRSIPLSNFPLERCIFQAFRLQVNFLSLLFKGAGRVVWLPQGPMAPSSYNSGERCTSLPVGQFPPKQRDAAASDSVQAPSPAQISLNGSAYITHEQPCAKT